MRPLRVRSAPGGESSNRDDTALKVTRPTNTPTPSRATATPRPACDWQGSPAVCKLPALPDLNCDDSLFRRLKVRQPDPHRFDVDFD